MRQLKLHIKSLDWMNLYFTNCAFSDWAIWFGAIAPFIGIDSFLLYGIDSFLFSIMPSSFDTIIPLSSSLVSLQKLLQFKTTNEDSQALQLLVESARLLWRSRVWRDAKVGCEWGKAPDQGEVPKKCKLKLAGNDILLYCSTLG